MKLPARFGYPGRCAIAAAAALLLTTLFLHTSLFQRVEWPLADGLARLTAPQARFDDVLVVDIDEESMARLASQLGPWPYDREIYALVTGYLLDAGARTVAYDILFSEPRGGDAAFAATLDPRIVLAAAALPYNLERDQRYRDRLEQKAWPAGTATPALAWPDITLPRAELAATAGVGVIGIVPDADGLLRHVPLLHRAYGQLLPGLPLAALHAGPYPPAVATEDGMLRVGAQRWPVNAHGEAALRYPADWTGLRTVPFYRIVLAAAQTPGFESVAADVRGRTVFVGSSSAMFGNLLPTPGGRVPGLHLMAIASSLLAGGHVLAPRAWPLEALLVLLALALPLAAAHPGLQHRVSVQLLALPLMLLLAGGAAAGLFALNRPVGILFPVTAAVIAHLLLLLWRQVHLNQQNQRLAYEKLAVEEAARLKSHFLSHVTHELRTPLTAIMGYNNINWLDDRLGRENRIRNGEIIDRSCRHLLALINDILDQAKIEAGQMTINRRPERLRDVVEDVLTTLRPLIGNRPLTLDAEYSDVPEAVKIDAFRVRQILLNLVGNALKFTLSGTVRVAIAWHEDRLTIDVKDTGPGIPPEALQRIFEAFRQADDQVAAKHGGTGLGLAISRNLVQLMGGAIEVASQPGKGTRFRVAFPAAAAAVAPAETPAANVAPTATKVLGGTVLVAEDSELVQMLTVTCVESLGLSALRASNGAAALDLALAEHPDAILMDMEMPVMDGVEATRALRDRGYTAPILALTGHGGPEEHRRALAAGCNAVLEKPVSRTALQIALEAALAPRAAADVSAVNPSAR